MAIITSSYRLKLWRVVYYFNWRRDGLQSMGASSVWFWCWVWLDNVELPNIIASNSCWTNGGDPGKGLRPLMRTLGGGSSMCTNVRVRLSRGRVAACFCPGQHVCLNKLSSHSAGLFTMCTDHVSMSTLSGSSRRSAKTRHTMTRWVLIICWLSYEAIQHSSAFTEQSPRQPASSWSELRRQSRSCTVQLAKIFYSADVQPDWLNRKPVAKQEAPVRDPSLSLRDSEEFFVIVLKL